MIIALIIAIFVVICLFEIPGLLKKKYWWELAIFIAFLLPGFVLTILLALNVKLPKPTDGISFLVKQILNIFG